MSDAPADPFPPLPPDSRLRVSTAAAPGDPALTVTVLPPRDGGWKLAATLLLGLAMLEAGAFVFLSGQFRVRARGGVPWGFLTDAALFTSLPVTGLLVVAVALRDQFGTTEIVAEVNDEPGDGRAVVSSTRRVGGFSWRWADRVPLGDGAVDRVVLTDAGRPQGWRDELVPPPAADREFAVGVRGEPGGGGAAKVAPAVSTADAGWLRVALGRVAAGTAGGGDRDAP